MSEETKRKIFASFYSTKGNRGTGLGLMVTSKIVMEHRGQISFESEEGEGPSFTIVLPPGNPTQAFNRRHRDRDLIATGKNSSEGVISP
jgi:signal transduction histidine kinase